MLCPVGKVGCAGVQLSLHSLYDEGCAAVDLPHYAYHRSTLWVGGVPADEMATDTAQPPTLHAQDSALAIGSRRSDLGRESSLLRESRMSMANVSDEASRRAHLHQRFIYHLARVLGASPGDLQDEEAPLVSLGLDSLGAMDLAARLSSDPRFPTKPVSVVEILRGNTRRGTVESLEWLELSNCRNLHYF